MLKAKTKIEIYEIQEKRHIKICEALFLQMKDNHLVVEVTEVEEHPQTSVFEKGSIYLFSVNNYIIKIKNKEDVLNIYN